MIIYRCFQFINNKAKEDFILGGGMDTDGDIAGGLDSGGGKKAKTGT